MEEIQTPERAPGLLFKVTLMRHEKPFYNDVGHDLMPEGVEGARNTGRKFKEEGRISDQDEVIFVHSPKARARGTADFFAEGAGLGAVPKSEINQLRSTDHKWEDLIPLFQELGGDLEKLAEAHYKHPIFNDRSDIVEPHQSKRERLYRSFEYLIRWLEKHPAEDKTPHIIAVSHFEIITHLINDVFGIENMKGYNTPSFGEVVNIEAFDSGDKDRVLLKVTYNEHNREVYFNRRSRSIEVI